MGKILIVSAHPDDEIIGMGGVIKKLSKNHKIQALFLADGITARKAGGHVNSTKYEVSKNIMEKMRKEIEIRKKHAKNALKVKVHETKQKMLDKKEMSKFTTEHEKRAFKTRPMADKGLFDDVLNVPLIFSGYGVKNHKNIPNQVRSIDIFPTIFDLIGASYENKNIHGKSLQPFFENETMEENPVYIESTVIRTVTKKPNPVVGVRTSNFKYFRSIEDPKLNIHLYDLKNDPLEDKNIATNDSQKVSEMELLLNQIQKDAVNQPQPEKLSKEEEDELEDELRKLGYI